jgi:hypothetical protein
MGSRLPALDPADVERGCLPVDLRPFQIAQLLRPQTVAISHQDEGGIALPLGHYLRLEFDQISFWTKTLEQ